MPNRPKSKTSELHVGVQELRSDIQISNPSLREYNSAQTFTLQGKNAVKLDWLGTSAVRDNGKAMSERVRLVATPGKSGLILYMVFVAPDADFEALSPTFDKIMNSFEVR